jgi:ribosomal protein L7/L12
MAKRLGVPEPSEDNKIKALIAEGKKNEAIKRYRDITGAGLKEANDYIEKLI